MAKKPAPKKAKPKRILKRTTSTEKAPTEAEAVKAARPQCGLCGKTKKLTKTECCDNWICDDEANYALFSYARNSCHRNHNRYTLCASHFEEGHKGRWQDCAKCREAFETEMYVYYGTNEYNFEVLADPPSFEPAKCHKCGKIIRLGKDGYVQSSKGYTCLKCSNLRL